MTSPACLGRLKEMSTRLLEKTVFSLTRRCRLGVVSGTLILLGLVGYGGYWCGRQSLEPVMVPTPTPATGTFLASPPADKFVGWSVYKSEEQNISFRYPPYLMIENPYPTEDLLRVDFIGEECAQVPVLERGHTPSLSFTITKSTDSIKEMLMDDVCAHELGPNCRGQTIIDPVPLRNGMAARLIKIFGVSGDGTSLVVTRSGLDFTFSSSSGPVPCGQRSSYTQEIFQMADTLVFGI